MPARAVASLSLTFGLVSIPIKRFEQSVVRQAIASLPKRPRCSPRTSPDRRPADYLPTKSAMTRMSSPTSNGFAK